MSQIRNWLLEGDLRTTGKVNQVLALLEDRPELVTELVGLLTDE